jgi:hypothetical protein
VTDPFRSGSEKVRDQSESFASAIPQWAAATIPGIISIEKLTWGNFSFESFHKEAQT